jgi:Polyketide cyclase / dehydrase and lipid transport
VRVRVGKTIDARPAGVWSVLEPIEQHADWMTDAESIAFTTEQRRGVGTAFDCVTRIGPFTVTDHMVVTEWEPERALGIEHHGLFTGSGRFTLRALPLERTRFTWTEEIRFPWRCGGPFGAFAAKPILRRVWAANLDRLARLVASDPERASGGGYPAE